MSADEKIKTAAGKVPIEMVPKTALFGASRVFAYGGRKYSEGNYFNAHLDDGAGGRYIGAALRHLAEMQLPNGLHTAESLAALDEESGLPHIDHVLCGLMMLRTIMTKCNALPVDPGVGKEPSTVAQRAEQLPLAPLMPLKGEQWTLTKPDICGEVRYELSTERLVREARVAAGAFDVEPVSPFTSSDKPTRTGPGDP